MGRKIGIELNIDVTKIDKAHIYEGKKGKYLKLTTFVDIDEKDQYENNGMVVQKVDKESQDKGIKGNILGNTRLFWMQGLDTQPQAPAPKPDFSMGGDPSDDTPFAPLDYIG